MSDSLQVAKKRGPFKFLFWTFVAGAVMTMVVNSYTSGEMAERFYHRAATNGYAVNVDSFKDATKQHPIVLRIANPDVKAKATTSAGGAEVGEPAALAGAAPIASAGAAPIASAGAAPIASAGAAPIASAGAAPAGSVVEAPARSVAAAPTASAAEPEKASAAASASGEKGATPTAAEPAQAVASTAKAEQGVAPASSSAERTRGSAPLAGAGERATPAAPPASIEGLMAVRVKKGDRLPRNTNGVISDKIVSEGKRATVQDSSLRVLVPWEIQQSKGFKFKDTFKHKGIETSPWGAVWNVMVVFLLGLSLGLMAEGFTDMIGIKLEKIQHHAHH